MIYLNTLLNILFIAFITFLTLFITAKIVDFINYYLLKYNILNKDNIFLNDITLTTFFYIVVFCTLGYILGKFNNLTFF